MDDNRLLEGLFSAFQRAVTDGDFDSYVELHLPAVRDSVPEGPFKLNHARLTKYGLSLTLKKITQEGLTAQVDFDVTPRNHQLAEQHDSASISAVKEGDSWYIVET